MSAAEAGQKFAPETGQMSADETRQMYSIKTERRPVTIVNICFASPAEICPVSAADICPVPIADISPVLTKTSILSQLVWSLRRIIIFSPSKLILPATVGGNFAKRLQEPSSKRTRPAGSDLITRKQQARAHLELCISLP